MARLFPMGMAARHIDVPKVIKDGRKVIMGAAATLRRGRAQYFNCDRACLPAASPPGIQAAMFNHCELMSERQVFKHEPGLGLEAGEQPAEKRQNDHTHDEVSYDRWDGYLNVFERLQGIRYPQP